jgi:hypothetical protein
MIQSLQKQAVFCAKKRQIFAKFFGVNIFKIITSVPENAGIKNWPMISFFLCGNKLLGDNNSLIFVVLQITHFWPWSKVAALPMLVSLHCTCRFINIFARNLSYPHSML